MWELAHKTGNLFTVTFLFTLMGLLAFTLASWVAMKLSPLSLQKALEEDRNLAVAIVVAATILGTAIIVAAAIQG
jgi:putative membrane protein